MKFHSSLSIEYLFNYTFHNTVIHDITVHEFIVNPLVYLVADEK